MYKPKKCAVCNTVFQPNSSCHKTCSPDCKWQRKKLIKRRFYKRHAKEIYQKNLKYLPDRLGRQIAMRLFRKLGIPQICQKCGSDYRCNVHHIDHNPQNNVVDNLIMLCRFCHAKAHSS